MFTDEQSLFLEFFGQVCADFVVQSYLGHKLVILIILQIAVQLLELLAILIILNFRHFIRLIKIL